MNFLQKIGETLSQLHNVILNKNNSGLNNYLRHYLNNQPWLKDRSVGINS